jgi:electron transfer flavoprotein beta subunit
VDVVVLAKHVPNPAGEPPEIGPDFRLRREESAGALDPSDAPGVALAARLVQVHGGTVTAISMGPDVAVRALHHALALGADDAVLVTDPLLRGADALATATVLAAAIARRPHDLVLAGVESSDGATGTMPMTLAELLELPCVTFARSLAVDGTTARVERQTEYGHDDVECALPLLVTLTAGVEEPRQPSLRETMAAKKKPVERLTLGDLGLDASSVAVSQAVTSLELAPARAAGELVDEEHGAARIADLLAEVMR